MAAIDYIRAMDGMNGGVLPVAQMAAFVDVFACSDGSLDLQTALELSRFGRCCEGISRAFVRHQGNHLIRFGSSLIARTVVIRS